MTKFQSKIIAAFIAAFTITNVACVNSNPYFGNDLIPPTQGMFTDIDSSIFLNTFVIKQDSMMARVGAPESDQLTILYAGNYNNDYTGNTISSFTSNYAPEGFKDIKVGFGNNPKIDSMTITMQPNYRKGDTSNFATLEIFKVKDFNFIDDSTYFTNFEIEKYIDPTPLISTQIKTGDRIVRHFPLSFAQEHFDANKDTSSVYFNDEKFHKKHNGLYFKLTTVNEHGPQYSFDLSATQMFLYYTNTDDEGKQDTLKQPMFFANSAINYVMYNTALQLYKHDYTTADQSVGGVNPTVINDTINPAEKIYVATQNSLGGKVVIDNKMVDDFIDKVKLKYGENSKIALHKAEIKWHVVDRTWQGMDTTLNRMAMYVDINKLGFMPEYLPILSINSLGGFITRSSGIYSMDITSTMQRIILGKNKLRAFELFPQLTDLMGEANTVVWGAKAKNELLRPKVYLLYTVVQ